MINEFSKQIHENNKAKGFYDDKKNIGEMLALIHSEVSEALECDRKGKYYFNSICDDHREWLIDRMADPNRTTFREWLIDGMADLNETTFSDDNFFKEQFENWIKDTFEDELADIMIRVMDLAAFKGVNLEKHIKVKMRYNALRPHKHGKKY